MDSRKTYPPNGKTPPPVIISDDLPDQGFQIESAPSVHRVNGALASKARNRRNAKRAIGILQHHAPALLEKAGMSTIPDSQLRPFQLAARQIRNELLAEIDNPSSIQRHLVGMCVQDLIAIETIDQYIGELANNGGIINRAEHDVYPILEKAFVLKNMLARRMKMIGIKGTMVKTKNVYQDTLAAWRQDTGKGTPPPPSPVKGQKKKTESSHQTKEAGRGKGKLLPPGRVAADTPPLP